MLAGLAQTRDFADIDYQSAVNRIAELTREHASAGGRLHRTRQAGRRPGDRAAADRRRGRRALEGGRASSAGSSSPYPTPRRRARRRPGDPGRAGCRSGRRRISAPSGTCSPTAGQPPPDKHGACDRAESTAAAELDLPRDKLGDRKDAAGQQDRLGHDRASATPTRSRPPSSTAPSRRRTATGSCTSGSPTTTCPASRTQFKTYLNQNTIREIAQFQAQLNRQSDLIKERIDTINRSLFDVDYNPGRYIRLEPQQTPNVEIRDFRADLRACTDDAVSAG